MQASTHTLSDPFITSATPRMTNIYYKANTKITFWCHQNVTGTYNNVCRTMASFSLKSMRWISFIS